MTELIPIAACLILLPIVVAAATYIYRFGYAEGRKDEICNMPLPKWFK